VASVIPDGGDQCATSIKKYIRLHLAADWQEYTYFAENSQL